MELVESSLEVFKRLVDVVLRVLFSGGLGNVRFTYGLYDLEGLFQPKQFYECILTECHCSVLP